MLEIFQASYKLAQTPAVDCTYRPLSVRHLQAYGRSCLVIVLSKLHQASIMPVINVFCSLQQLNILVAVLAKNTNR